MLPDFGSRLRDFLFNPMSDLTKFSMRVEIENALQTWEDRIAIKTIDILSYEDDNKYEIFVYYTITRTNQPGIFKGVVRPSI